MYIITLAHLASHIAVELNDTIVTPTGVEGKLVEVASNYGTLECEGGARMTTSLPGLGLVYMNEVYLKSRPEDGAPVRHSH